MRHGRARSRSAWKKGEASRPLTDTGRGQAKALAPMMGIAVVTLWRWAATGKFPKPVKLGARATAWKAEDVRQWMASKNNLAA